MHVPMRALYRCGLGSHVHRLCAILALHLQRCRAFAGGVCWVVVWVEKG